MPPELNPYSLLGVARTATAEEISKAYRQQAKTWHPDRCLTDAQREAADAHFKRIGAAYDILKEKQSRALLDADLAAPRPYLPRNHVTFNLARGEVALHEVDIELRNDGGAFTEVGFERTDGPFWRIFPPVAPNLDARDGGTVAMIKVVQAYPLTVAAGEYADLIHVLLDDRAATLNFQATIK